MKLGESPNGISMGTQDPGAAVPQGSGPKGRPHPASSKPSVWLVGACPQMDQPAKGKAGDHLKFSGPCWMVCKGETEGRLFFSSRDEGR